MKILKVARIRKGLTQQKLSHELGMSIATVNRIENGVKSIDSIKVGDLKKICNILNLDIADVLKDSIEI